VLIINLALLVFNTVWYHTGAMFALFDDVNNALDVLLLFRNAINYNVSHQAFDFLHGMDNSFVVFAYFIQLCKLNSKCV